MFYALTGAVIVGLIVLASPIVFFIYGLYQAEIEHKSKNNGRM